MACGVGLDVILGNCRVADCCVRGGIVAGDGVSSHARVVGNQRKKSEQSYLYHHLACAWNETMRQSSSEPKSKIQLSRPGEHRWGLHTRK